MASEDRVTLVVATRDRRAMLLDALEMHRASLPGGGEPDRRIVVVDNGSSDGTSEAVRRAFPGVEVVRLARNTGAAARTVGASLAGTRYVAFSDDDSWWEPGALARACDLLDADPSVALVTGSVVVGPEVRPDPINRLLAAGARRPGGPGVAVLGFLACAAVVRRDVFLSTGGFPPQMVIGGEEELLALDLAAAGWVLVYEGGLVVRHRPDHATDRAGRGPMEVRNAIAVSLARRRVLGMPSAVVRSTEGLRPTDRWRVLRDTATLLPWVVRNRSPVPPPVERAFRDRVS